MADYEKRVEVRNLDELSRALSKSFAAVKKDIYSIKDMQARQAVKLELISDNVAKLSDRKDKYATEADYKAMHHKIEALNKEISELRDSLRDYEKIREELLALEKDDDHINERISGVYEKIEKLQALFEEVSDTKNILTKLEGIKAASEKIKELEKKTVSQSYFDKQISEVTQMIAAVKEEIEEVRRRAVDEQEHKKQMSLIEKRINELKSMHKEAESEISYLNNSKLDERKYKKDMSQISRRLKKIKKPDAVRHNKLFFASNILIILAFISLAVSIFTYFFRYNLYTYPTLIIAVTLFLIGIVFRIISILREK